MNDLTPVESIIWRHINEKHVGKENAIRQEELLGVLAFYPEYDIPLTLRALRKVIRGLKQKRPLLESLRNNPGYHKPKNWQEIIDCLERRKRAAIRQLALNKQMLMVCKELFPNEVAQQLEMFEYKKLNNS